MKKKINYDPTKEKEGSDVAQILNLSNRIKILQHHLQRNLLGSTVTIRVKKNHKDYSAKRTLVRLNATRRKLLRSIKEKNPDKASSIQEFILS